MKPHELLSALMAARGLGSLPLAKAMGKPKLQAPIHRFKAGSTQEPARTTTEPLASFFNVPVDAFYDERVATDIAKRLGLTRPPSPPGEISRSEPRASRRGMNESSIKVPEKPMTWRDLRMLAKLPPSFVVELEDDAMAPDFPAGTVVQFETSVTPAYGNRVLIRDTKGELHFRLFAQSAEDEWEGQPKADGFLTLYPGRDGARVVAVKSGHYVKGA